MPAPPDSQPTADTYEIRLSGHLDGRWAARLEIPNLVHHADGTTVLGGIRSDQAVLHGLLQRIRDLGLPLISVVRVGPNQPDPEA
ncbi:MAG: hypothetical protein ABL866_07415 [Devosia sp.]